MNSSKSTRRLAHCQTSDKTGLRISIVLLTILCGMLLDGCGTGADTGTPTTSSTPANLPVWTNSFNSGGVQVPFTMVGTDPTIAGAGTTNVQVQIIPIRFNFAGVLVTPESAACGDTSNAITRVQNSPLFTTNIPWSDAGTPIGTTQFPDAFQRANFWHFVSTISPNYHVMLQPVSTSATVNVDVPIGIGAALLPNPACPQHPIGGIPSAFMNSVVQNIVQAQHISPGILPIFLTFDTQFLPEGFWGYHSALAGNQTFVVASYTDPALIGPNVADVLVLSHELAEWINNPLGVNHVALWGNAATGCRSELEVGDPLPLPQSSFAVAAPGFSYHIQELAYFSWFARISPSIAINGRYSTNGTFVTPAPPCP